jgi:Protein of unknown function (DUF1353)
VRAVICASLVLVIGCNGKVEKPGQFEGTVKTEWIDENPKMRLLEDFSFIDAKGVKWSAPKNSVIDGASIPQVLWSVVGSPYTGKYRRASVVHDVACVKRDQSWQDVHRMFYEACLAGGVDERDAKLMYGAVYHFGPKWSPGGASIMFARAVPVEQEFAQLKTYVETGDRSLEEIEQFSPAR